MTNNEERGALSESEEIAALLPWYVAGKLGEADRDRVESYVAEHPEAGDHIALAREEADAVFATNQEIHIPRGGLDRLRASVGARRSSGAFGSSLFDRIGAFLDSFTPRQVAYAGIAAALILAAGAASIGAMLSHYPGSGLRYQTASGTRETPATGTFALVAFKPEAPLSAVSSFLADSKFSIVEGPKAGGLYRVQLAGSVLSKAEADAALAKLKARADLIAFASAAPSSP